MKTSSIRFGLCLAIAVIAAAVADPIVEFASNAGWFGPGSFTDGSNLDVVPALAAGAILLLLYLARKARVLVAEGVRAGGIAARMPLIFGLQLVTLYAMETSEQVVVRGHVLGPTIWLGGPILFSLAIHALCCTAIALWVARSARSLAATTLRVIHLIRAIGTLAVHVVNAVTLRSCGELCLSELSPVLCRIGVRAPPTPRRHISRSTFYGGTLCSVGYGCASPSWRPLPLLQAR